jgi:Glucose / Sorbosone dehydrogenase
MASSTAGFDLQEDIVDFEGKGKYRDPQFAWVNTVGPTALTFLNSDKLGIQYVNDMFVGDVHNGWIYHFDLHEDRTALILDGLLADKVAHTDSELEEHASVIFGEGFGGITDLEVGPDGYLYVVSIGQGAIYRIVAGVNGGSGVTTDIDDDEQGEDNVESEDNISSNDEGEADEDGNLDVDEGGGAEGDTAEAE